jgi:hypothetical protein
MKDKNQIKKERKKLSQLVNKWDPLGLIKIGSPEDEYDCLSDKVYSMLNRNVQEEAMITEIALEFENHFGCPVKPESIRIFAKKLNSLRLKHI